MKWGEMSVDAEISDLFLRKIEARVGKENRRMMENLEAWAEVLGALGWKVALAIPGRMPVLNATADQWAADISVAPMPWDEITERLAAEQPLRVMASTPRLLVWTDAREDFKMPVTSVPFTKREGEVLQWLQEGKTGPEIAIILGCGQRTVESHVARIYRKLGVRRRSELIFETELKTS